MYDKYTYPYFGDERSGNCMGMDEAKSFTACTRGVLYVRGINSNDVFNKVN
jgi:hypothetical protein